MQASSGHGADLIIDGLGQQAMTENLSALPTFGHWVSLGRASGAIPTVDPHALLAKSATFSAPAVLHYTSDPTRLRQMADRLRQALQM